MKNPHKLTLSEIKKLKVNKNNLLENKELFWINCNYPNDFCISGSCGNGYNSFFIRISESKIESISFSSYFDMTNFKFESFFDDENNKDDDLIQEMFLEQINKLIDVKILIGGKK